MAIYLYDPGTGAKILTEGNAIATHEDCCCGGASTCYKLRECGQDSNTCNTCDPPIPDTLYVTFSGLGGDFATYNNNTYTLTWSSGCEWTGSPGGGATLSLTWVTSAWDIQLGIDIDCYFDMDGPTTSCNPAGGYTLDGCGAGDCVSTSSCTSSTGATATVSLTDTSSSTLGTGEICVDDDLSTYSYGDVLYYNSKCYYFVGEMTCTGSPTTMTSWVDFADCDACDVTCNSCSPALKSAYSVEVYFSWSPFNAWNGTYTVTWDGSGCTWSVDDPGTLSGYVLLECDGSTEWSVLVWDDGEGDGYYAGVASYSTDGVGDCDPYSNDAAGKYYGDGSDYAIVEDV